ncbi:hypothetical protein D3C84_561720 [compost metagenome]
MYPGVPGGIAERDLTASQGHFNGFFERQTVGHGELLLQVAPERGALVADVFFAQFFLPGAVVQVLQRVLVVAQGFTAQQAAQFTRQHPQRCLVEAACRGQQGDERLPCSVFNLRHHQRLIRIFNHDFTAATQGFGHRRLAAQKCEW